MSGELVALFSALLWAIASVLLAVGTKRLHVLPLNLVRCVVATAFFWAMLPFYGGLKALAAIPPDAWLWLVVSVLALLVVGDTLYFRSMNLAGVSWAMPVASINPLWAVFLSMLFVDEPLSWPLLAGALLVIAGVALVSKPTSQASRGNPAHAVAPALPAEYHSLSGGGVPPVPSVAGGSGAKGARASHSPAGEQSALSNRTRRVGLLLALVVSVLWAIGQVALKPATAGVHSVVANSIRQPIGALLLLGLTLVQGRWRELGRLDGRTWGIIIVASLIGTGIGSLFFVMAIQMTGAGRTAVLTTTAPIMALPFSMLWLHERPSRWTLVGTLLTTAGIGLVA